jgi:hypothetical protein
MATSGASIQLSAAIDVVDLFVDLLIEDKGVAVRLLSASPGKWIRQRQVLADGKGVSSRER